MSFDVGQVLKVLGAYPMLGPAQDIVAVSSGFSGAGIWKVETDGGTYCVRRWPLKDLSPPRIVELHRWLEHLARCGIPVSVPLRQRSGTALVQWERCFWQVEPWRSGESQADGTPADARLRHVMRTLAALHFASERYVAPASGRPTFEVFRRLAPPAIRERLERISRLDEESVHDIREGIQNCVPELPLRTTAQSALEMISRFRTFIETELRGCLDMQTVVFPCWRDLWKAHVLFEGDEVTGLIDASAARTDHPAVDLARLLGSLVGDDRKSWQAALDTYTALRPISIEEQRLVTVLDHSGTLLSSLTWLERLAANEIAVADTGRVEQRLTQLVVRLSRLQSN